MKTVSRADVLGITLKRKDKFQVYYKQCNNSFAIQLTELSLFYLLFECSNLFGRLHINPGNGTLILHSSFIPSEQTKPIFCLFSSTSSINYTLM